MPLRRNDLKLLFARHALSHPEELHNIIIIESIMGRKRAPG